MNTYSSEEYRRSKQRYKQSKTIQIVFIIICIAAFAGLIGIISTNAYGEAREVNTAYMSKSKTQQIDKSQWNLILVNAQNKIPEGYKLTLRRLSNGIMIDERIYQSLQQMLVAARADGVYPVITSGYRTADEQKSIMEEKIEYYKDNGYYSFQAKARAKKLVAEVNCSEHQIGLAVDINADTEHSTNNEVYDWLSENGYKYGFILRYSKDKEGITGIEHEPWHYRYVGIEAAEYMYNQNLCLEEYLQIN